MAAPLGRTDPSVAELLLQSPWNFDFFQAVRLLAAVRPDRLPISGFRKPLEESVRFHARISMAFPSSAVHEISPGTQEGGPLHVTVNFMGLAGPMGVLPAHYTEYLIARSYAGDNAAAAFFDLFNHRLISLFYLAWEKHHVTVGYGRDTQPQSKQSGFTRYLLDMIGMGTEGLQGQLAVRDSVLLSYCGLLAQRPHSASALAGLLRDYFQAPVEIDQFAGKWCRLDEEDLSCLGGRSVPSQLGSGAVAGRHVWSPQARFRIRLGPLTWQRFQSFLPGGSALEELIALARHFVNRTMDFEVQSTLLAAAVPLCRLTGDHDSPRLGLSSWLKTVSFTQDAGDLVLVVRS
jgi:type VI secretion system protein ImpH